MKGLVNFIFQDLIAQVGRCLILLLLFQNIARVTAQIPESPVPKDKIVRAGETSCRNALGGIITRQGLEGAGDPRVNPGMKGISVNLLDASGQVVATTRTNRNGRYGFHHLCPGNYTICPGIPCPAGGHIPSRYSPPSIDVQVPPLVQTGLNFSFLEPPHQMPRELPRANGNN